MAHFARFVSHKASEATLHNLPMKSRCPNPVLTTEVNQDQCLTKIFKSREAVRAAHTSERYLCSGPCS